MKLLWWLVAKVVAIPTVAGYLIKRAQRTPYFHLEGYMNRWWLFNPYGNNTEVADGKRHEAKYPWLPSIRIHHILREDFARDMHDHPWDARTIILKGAYLEERLVENHIPFWEDVVDTYTECYTRLRGDTATLKFGEFHNITSVSLGGVWTLFITWKYMGTWGFWVNGHKVPWREYTNEGAA